MDLRKDYDWDWVDLGCGVIRLISYLPEEETSFDDIVGDYLNLMGLVNHYVHFVNWGVTMDGYDFLDIETTPMK